MNLDFNPLKKLVNIINPEYALSQDWCERVNKLGNCVEFVCFACKVLQAEIDGSFYDRKHYEKTLREKNSLSHHLSCLLSELIGAIYSLRLPLDGTSSFLGDFTSSQVQQISNEIADKGYYVWPKLLPQDMVDSLLDELQGKEYKNTVTGKKITGKEAAGLEMKRYGTWWIDNAYDMPVTETLQNISLDPAILAIAQESLGATPIHVQTNSWWTFPPPLSAVKERRKTRFENKNAQRFHQDQEFVTFLKVFIYLSDVSEKNGPHIYVEGSANDYEEKLPTKVSSDRRTDEEIIRAFGKERVRSITGLKGQIAFVNTRGFHRGSSVIEGYRALLQLEYASSLYFNSVDPFDMNVLSENNKLLYNQNPRVFMNYLSPEKINRKSADGWYQKLRQKLSYFRSQIEELVF